MSVAQSRARMVEARSSAHMQRRLHDGEGTLARESAREHVDELSHGDVDDARMEELRGKEGPLTGSEGLEVVRGMYAQADELWSRGEMYGQAAEMLQEEMTTGETFSDAGKLQAEKRGVHAAHAYGKAAHVFQMCLDRMAMSSRYLLGRSDFKKHMAGNNYGHQNDFWRAMA